MIELLHHLEKGTIMHKFYARNSDRIDRQGFQTAICLIVLILGLVFHVSVLIFFPIGYFLGSLSMCIFLIAISEKRFRNSGKQYVESQREVK